LGTYLQQGESMAFVHAADTASAERARLQLTTAFTLSDSSIEPARQAKPTLLSTLYSSGS
jgi:hypothetical protein